MMDLGLIVGVTVAVLAIVLVVLAIIFLVVVMPPVRQRMADDRAALDAEIAAWHSAEQAADRLGQNGAEGHADERR